MATTNKKRTRNKTSISTARPRSYSNMYKNDNTLSPQTASTPSVVRSTEPRYTAAQTAADTDWKSQYAYVMQDLRLLLIVSVVLIAIIVIASFFM